MQKVFTTWHGDKKLISEDRIVPRHSAYGVVINEGRILLIGLKTSSKHWFPGGVIEDGETYEEAVEREVKEETGIDVDVKELPTEVESYFYYDPLDVAWQQFSHFYLCEAKSIDLLDFVNPDAHDEAGKPIWLDFSSVEEKHMQDYGFEIIKLVSER